ncbi:MAG: META domain-containing protein [Weeksellaceae bacterium]
MKKLQHVLILAIMSLLLAACGTTAVTSNKVSDLEGVWNLQNDGQTTLGIGNNPITLIFDPSSEDNISGFSGCNNYGGTMSGKSGFISFSNIYSTKMSCPYLDLEDDYLDLLKQVDRFEVSRKDLYLYKNKLLLLHFKK